jgi:hypothetical protein
MARCQTGVIFDHNGLRDRSPVQREFDTQPPRFINHDVPGCGRPLLGRSTGVRMAEEWLTYSDLAERLGVSSEAARQKAIRQRWPRRTANDGKAQVRVDVEDVRATMSVRRPKDEPAPDDRPTPDDPLSNPQVLVALGDHIETLRTMVAKAESIADRERERADSERVRADKEQGRADAERARADEISARLEEVLSDRRKRAQMNDAIQQEVTELRSMVEKMTRPWWRRIASR